MANYGIAGPGASGEDGGTGRQIAEARCGGIALARGTR